MFFRRKPFKNEAHQSATRLLGLMLEKHTGIPYQILEMQYFDKIRIEEIDTEKGFKHSLKVYFDNNIVGVLNI